MVYIGKYKEQKSLDPHFEENENSPVARFVPTENGLKMAINLARSLS